MSTTEVTPMPRKPIPAVRENPDNLADKTFPLVLRFGLFGISKKVKTSQVEVVGDAKGETDKTMLRASKKLLDSPEYEAIKTADREFKERLDTVCLPFDIPGARLVPLRAYEYVVNQCEEYTNAIRPGLVNAFLAVYDDAKADAERRLGPLHNPRDYPQRDAVERDFTFSYQFIEYGTPGKLRDIDRAQYLREREKQAQFMKNAAEEITAALRGMFAELVNRLRDSLSDDKTPSGKRRKLYDSTVEKLREFMSTFDFRNVNDDAELQGLVSQMRALMEGASIEALKTTDSLRAKVRDGASQIGAKLETMVETTTARKFRLQDLDATEQ